MSDRPTPDDGRHPSVSSGLEPQLSRGQRPVFSGLEPELGGARRPRVDMALLQAILQAPDRQTLTMLADRVIQSAQATVMARALAACVHPRARRPGRLLGGGYTIKERLNALAMIRLLQRPVDVMPLVEAIYDLRRPEIWGHAAATMGEVGLWLDWSSPQMAHLTHAFQVMLRHPEPSVRSNAARYLGELSAYEAIEALQKRLAVEEVPGVRRAIVLALSQLDEARGVLTLLDAQNHGEVSREDCLAALVRVGRRAVEPLIGVLRRYDVRLNSRAIAAEALGRIGDPAAWATLEAVRDDETEPIALREEAGKVLDRLGWSCPEPPPWLEPPPDEQNSFPSFPSF
ncbi:MAG: hypothetical protein Kow00124_23460 [Anaerolineae bacterium]